MNEAAAAYLRRLFSPTLASPSQVMVIAGESGSLKLALPWLAQQLAGRPELIVSIEPDGASIKIAQVKPLYSLSFRRRDSNERRVVVIEPADLMSQPAQNALLKLLEEPPPGVYFLLGTSELSSLAATVLSRARLLELPRLSEVDFRRIYEGVYPAGDLARRFRLSNGDPLIASRLDEVELALDQVKDYLSAPLPDVVSSLNKQNPSRQQVVAWCQQLGRLCRAAIDSAQTAPELERWLRRGEAVLSAQRWLKANTNHKLALNWLLLEMRQ